MRVTPGSSGTVLAGRGPADTPPLAGHTIVAVLLFRHGRLCLLRRSAEVGSDSGKWHCVTGFLDAGIDPNAQAFDEIFEETGLGRTDLDDLTVGPVLDLHDELGDGWKVHLFIAHARRDDITLNWEHDAARWVAWPSEGSTLTVVPWLSQLMRAITIPSLAIAA